MLYSVSMWAEKNKIFRMQEGTEYKQNSNYRLIRMEKRKLTTNIEKTSGSK